jgi:catechol 2,3-dioxygenase-like lactoylglutathione lyase family enzyme
MSAEAGTEPAAPVSRGGLGLESLHHVSVCVTDIERAKRFYGDVLGLKEVTRPDFPFGGAWYEFDDGKQIHLIVHPETRTMRGVPMIDIRDGHLALRVRSYQETVDHLRAHGVELLEWPRNVTPWLQIYVTDPDGNVIEFNVDRP